MPCDQMAKSEKFFQNLKARGYRLWLYLLFYLNLWLSARHMQDWKNTNVGKVTAIKPCMSMSKGRFFF